MSYQDIKHHYQDYDPCEHGQDSRCLDCEVQRVQRYLAESEEECCLLQELLRRVVRSELNGYSEAEAYLTLRGL